MHDSEKSWDYQDLIEICRKALLKNGGVHDYEDLLDLVEHADKEPVRTAMRNDQ